MSYKSDWVARTNVDNAAISLYLAMQHAAVVKGFQFTKHELGLLSDLGSHEAVQEYVRQNLRLGNGG